MKRRAAATVRAATVADAGAIAKVHVLSWQQAYRHLLPRKLLAGLSVERRQAMWEGVLANGEPSLLVAEVNDEIVGFSAFGRCRDDGSRNTDRELWAIYVTPSQWSTGAGRALWLKSREAMVAGGATRISLWVLVGNERAIGFYTAAGFRAEPDSIKLVELGGLQFHEMRYVLNVVAE